MQKRAVVIVMLFALALAVDYPVLAQNTSQPRIDQQIAQKIATILKSYHIASGPPETRGTSLANLYWTRVWDVPAVISTEALGSSVLLTTRLVDGHRVGLVVTNHHVVTKPFYTEDGKPFVVLLFYDPVLKNQPFDVRLVVSCYGSTSIDPEWCQAFMRSLRPALILREDPERDLALLLAFEVPSKATGIPPGNISLLHTGDSVAIIGNPEGLLWTLTTGIVSAVRNAFPLGTSFGTVIQTQAPINPGNSGGPLLDYQGSLVGVVFATRASTLATDQVSASVISNQGLNFAIGVNEVIHFLREAQQ
jgi:S1-C subfamily serine protease